MRGWLNGEVENRRILDASPGVRRSVDRFWRYSALYTGPELRPRSLAISEGRDVGNITARKFGPDGPVEVPCSADSAYHVFLPDRKFDAK